MKAKYAILMLILSPAIFGCQKDNGSAQSTGQNFAGITERNEFGDTLAVDSSDWVISAPFAAASFAAKTLPCYLAGKYIGNRDVLSPRGDLEYSIGAFPNPFIGGAGRLFFEIITPTAGVITLRAEDESGAYDILVFYLEDAAAGYYLIPWQAADSAGNLYPEGIYRIFFQSGVVSSFGDVELTVTQHSNPGGNAPYVLFALGHFDAAEYLNYEYSVAVNYGPSGILGGMGRYEQAITAWNNLSYGNKLVWLPLFMNYDLFGATSYQYHYLLAYKHFQFGAGWPNDQDFGITDSTKAWWQKENADHNTFVDLFEGG